LISEGGKDIEIDELLKFSGEHTCTDDSLFGTTLAASSAGTGGTLTPREALSESQRYAIEQYSKAEGLYVQAVTLKTVEDSTEGLVHWASYDRDTSAGSKMGQAFRRAVRLTKYAILMSDMSDSVKKEFRMHWHVKKDFDFTTHTRVVTRSRKRATEETGASPKHASSTGLRANHMFPSAHRKSVAWD
jgi:hypothetical protein